MKKNMLKSIKKRLSGQIKLLPAFLKFIKNKIKKEALKALMLVLFLTSIKISIFAVENVAPNNSSSFSSFQTIQENSVMATSPPIFVKNKKLKMVITAYSSTTWETDDTPFITAAGTYVKKGIVANNMLPIGTKVKIPEIYGDKIFVVEDRMNPKKGYYHLDIWFSQYYEAKKFGAKLAYVEILED